MDWGGGGGRRAPDDVPAPWASAVSPIRAELARLHRRICVVIFLFRSMQNVEYPVHPTPLGLVVS